MINEKIDEKLALQNNLPDLDQRFVEIAREALLNFGTLSNAYLMRKLKCSASEAKKIMVELGIATYYKLSDVREKT